MTEKESKKGKKRTGKLLSSFVVLTIVLSVLAASVTSVSAQVPPAPKVTEIVVSANPSSIPAEEGSTSTITATVINWTGAGPGDLDVYFEIEGPDYGTSISPEWNRTDDAGNATATLTAGAGVEPGTVTVKVTGQGGIAVNTTQVTLSGAPEVTSIVVSPPVAELIVGGTQQFTATAYNQYGGVMPDIEFAWTRSNGTVGTVNGTGFFEASALGSTLVNATNASIVGNASVTVTEYAPDLIVTEITPNCDEIFANESNTVNATIKNNGTAAAGAFNVSFVVGAFSEEVEVSGLAIGASEEVTVTDPTLRNAGESVTITVTADCDGEVGELDEANNATSIAKTVVNNGYKGKTYTGGEDITTLQTHTLNGSVLYSTGDSYYLGGGTSWTQYIANWTASDLPVPDGATSIVKARLYVYYTWDKVQGMPGNVSMEFNDNPVTIDAFYTDRKGYGTWDFPFGMLTYDVTTDFNTSGNTAVLENQNPVAGNPSIQGMLLVVIYADATEPERTIWINEECDILAAKSSYCTTPEEATAYAPFAGTIEDIANKSAKLITVAPSASAGDDENRLYFNDQVWNGVWDHYDGATELGIAETDVSDDLKSGDNIAKFQDNGDWMEASNAILVVEEVLPEKKFTIDFVTGYNMISLPLNDTSVTNASSLVAKIGANCTEVFKWNTTTQGWESYNPSMPSAAAFGIVGGEGYFVSMSGPETVVFRGIMGWESPFSMSLVTGYNMIGIPVNDTSVTNASLLIAEIGANCTEIFKWNKTSQGWESYNPSMPPAAAFNIGCGEGYFVSMAGPADVAFEGEPCQD